MSRSLLASPARAALADRLRCAAAGAAAALFVIAGPYARTAHAEPIAQGQDGGTAPKPAAKKAAEPLPEPEIRARVIAPSAKGPWTLRLENEGERWLRVPADLRLLHLSVESGDTISRKAAKAVSCVLPAALRVTAFPDRNALLLGPGDAYVETFDPRLFCFGKDAAAVAGGALVRAHYGWEAPKGARKVDPPFAVEGTTFPASVEPKKQLVVPSLVLSWLPPDLDEEEPHAVHDGGSIATPPSEGAKDAAEKDAEKKEIEAEVVSPKGPVDENAPRLELTVPAFADAANGHRISLTFTVANAGHRPALAAIRPRMAAFRVDGPDGVVRCHAAAPSNNLPPSAFQTLKPGASTSFTLLVEEACGQELFRRPGLYRITAALHLNERSPDPAIVAMLGVVHAREPTLVRIAEGPSPFYKSPPQVTHATPQSPPLPPKPAEEKTGGP